MLKKLIPFILMAFVTACAPMHGSDSGKMSCCEKCECCKSGMCKMCAMKDGKMSCDKCECCKDGKCKMCDMKGKEAGDDKPCPMCLKMKSKSTEADHDKH